MTRLFAPPSRTRSAESGFARFARSGPCYLRSSHMGYIPANAKWWLADIIVEFTVEGTEGNLVHYKLTLVRADSPEEAYEDH